MRCFSKCYSCILIGSITWMFSYKTIYWKIFTLKNHIKYYHKPHWKCQIRFGPNYNLALVNLLLQLHIYNTNYLHNLKFQVHIFNSISVRASKYFLYKSLISPRKIYSGTFGENRIFQVFLEDFPGNTDPGETLSEREFTTFLGIIETLFLDLTLLK